MRNKTEKLSSDTPRNSGLLFKTAENYTYMYQHAQYGKCTHKPFLKKVIAHTTIVALHEAALDLRDLHLTLQGCSHDIFCQIYSNLSVLPHHFLIPCLHFCFLISMVRLYTNEWTGNRPFALRGHVTLFL